MCEKYIVKNKLRSETGASLSIALLLFVVCAAIGAVVLTAGTTAGGRASRLAELDQRYYSVASAAELLIKEFDNQETTIVREKVKETATTYTITTDVNGQVSVSGSAPSTTYSYSTKINALSLINNPGSSISTTNMGFLTVRAVKLMFGENTCNTDEAMGYSFSSGNPEPDTDFTITHTVVSRVDPSDLQNVNHLTINGKYRMKNDGTLIITLQDGISTTDNYVLTLTMGTDIDEKESTISNSSTTELANGYKQIDKTTTTKTSKIKWVVNSIETGSVPDEIMGGGSGG